MSLYLVISVVKYINNILGKTNLQISTRDKSKNLCKEVAEE